jgi:two-component system phosphate regulon sensor histidine kinase PhoR
MMFTGYKKTIKQLNKALEDISLKLADMEKHNSSMRAIIRSMAEGVILVDISTKILAINRSAETIFGILKKDTEGKLLLEAIRNSDIADLADSALKGGRFVSREITLALPVAAIFIVNVSPIFEDGRTAGCVLVIHDITELRRLEIVRRDFVANVSHELKTPLTSIKGFIETLLESALEDSQNSRNFLKIIADHVNRLDELISDLLSLSYLESGQAGLKKESFAMKPLTEKILSGFKSQMTKKNIKIENVLPASLLVNADKDKISQVLANLIDNAIKFNNEKGIIKIYSEPSKEGVKITVEDSGIGMPSKDIPRIFERFYRVDKARSRELGGTGLGLESTEGLGSKFWFTLPK